MQYTKVDATIQKRLTQIINEHYPLVQSIAQKLAERGCQALLVGGAVRDLFLGLPLKDLDIEVYNCSLQQLEAVLGEFGQVSLVGKAFGVLRAHGLEADWSVPRSDAFGRKPEVVLDPNLSYEKAFARRDLTINAMGINLITFELIDPFDGFTDLKKKILRAPDPVFFIEDPLRFYRVMQFVGRFEMKPDAILNKLCSEMDLKSVSRERIEAEFAKLLLKSKQPSLGISWLDEIGRLKDILPEIAATKGVPQEPDWHPEGDVYEHTKQALDAAAALEYASQEEKLKIVYAALCHDLGKLSTTQIFDGKIISYGHEKKSETLAKRMLKRIMRNKDLISCISKLARYHMQPGQLVKNNAKFPAYKRLARKLAPEISMQMLGKLMLADRQGRNPKKGAPLTEQFSDVASFLEKAKEAFVLHEPEKPILQGRDLLDVIKPGPELGKLIKRAYKIQIDDGIRDKEELKKRVLSNN
ncbi:MAG TPA: HD domain-containing protein [Candidatus Babeliales bacterium]|nr:HD domain-containing protein [Candidatus Babeliales bacterium]